MSLPRQSQEAYFAYPEGCSSSKLTLLLSQSHPNGLDGLIARGESAAGTAQSRAQIPLQQAQILSDQL